MPRIDQTIAEKPFVKCTKCGYKWTPDPTKWRNNSVVEYRGIPAKMLPCPVCNTRHFLSLERAEEIMAWYHENANNKRLSR